MKKFLLLTLPIFLIACQSTPKPTNAQITPLPSENTPTNQQGEPTNQEHQPLKFTITGKIGITTQTTQGKQAVSAFYAWSQDNERFAIDLTGAMGVGATTIRYDGQTATLTNEKSGTLTADNPEELFTKATGLQAPIGRLPHWILGKNTPEDSDNTFDNGRLTSTKNADWTATFDYNNSATPTRLKLSHTDGHRVVLSINHQ